MAKSAIDAFERILTRTRVALATIGMIVWSHARSGLADETSGRQLPADQSATQYKYTNKLIDSNDPYLLLHAHNPVDWYPWGPEALAKAREENKPIFISIGYSTCFWCHVAERTIYSNPNIAKLMNQWFVNIKVDSEERPDLDRIYMLARQIMTGQGGWPNNVFLTPDLKPFYAGSYFPPRDDPRAGPGFPTILAAINQGWTSDRAQVLGVAENVMTAMRRVQSAIAGHGSAPIEPRAWMAKARDTLLPQFDPLDGGLADRHSATKFPNSPRLALLLSDYRVNGTSAALSDVLDTLDAIAFGGIHDQVSGGFHRYSTEPSWSVPHFEKMLYDNARLLQLYTSAFQITNKPFCRQIAIETARYLGKDMMSGDGGFYTARDAQLDGIEGEGYLWTRGEISSILGAKEAARFLTAYGLTPLPRANVPDVAHPSDVGGEAPAVLRLRVPIDQTLKDTGLSDVAQLFAEFAADRTALMAAREKRRQPARDEKIVVSLNGLAIQALAESGQILREPEFVDWAKMAAERIWSLAYDQKAAALRHQIFMGEAKTDGFLQDYAALGLAFATLYEATGDKSWRDRASRVADSLLDRFSRPDGSFSITPNEKDLLIPLAEEGDLEMPSGTSLAIELLLRLHKASRQARYLSAAVNAVRRLSGQFRDHPENWASAIAALNLYPLPSAPETATAANTAAATSAPADFRVPVSADHVHITASKMPMPEGDAVVVTVKVDDNLHINANPASYDYLIPTSLAFKSIKPSNVEYPAATRFTAKFAPEGLDVYEGSVAIIAKFSKDSLKDLSAVQGTISVQACNSQICLPPSELPISIGSSGQ